MADAAVPPGGLYRVTQGDHVLTGVASIPILLAKLWTVYPHLWSRPVFASPAHAVERLSLAALVGGSLFLLFTGTINIAYWYEPMRFSFTAGHYWAAWITMGGLIVHIGAKVSTHPPGAVQAQPRPAGAGRRRPQPARLPRCRGADVGGAARRRGRTDRGALRKISVLAPRRPDAGPQGYPVNRTAAQAGVGGGETDDDRFVLSVEGDVGRPLTLGLTELRAMPQRTVRLPISCVEGWSFSARWTGVPLRDLLALAGAPDATGATVESMEAEGAYRTSPLNRLQARDPDTLLALELDGQPLALDHGYPLRLIAPNRPGVQQTKWVGRIVVA